jgi:hypothetical protein
LRRILPEFFNFSGLAPGKLFFAGRLGPGELFFSVTWRIIFSCALENLSIRPWRIVLTGPQFRRRALFF